MAGESLPGARLFRTLWVLRREEVSSCPVFGSDHTEPTSKASYRATTLASDRHTDEDWKEVLSGSVFQVDPHGAFHREALNAV